MRGHDYKLTQTGERDGMSIYTLEIDGKAYTEITLTQVIEILRLEDTE